MLMRFTLSPTTASTSSPGRHETGTVGAADGYARISGKPGIADDRWLPRSAECDGWRAHGATGLFARWC